MMKFPIKPCIIAVCVLIIVLSLSACSTQVTASPNDLQVTANSEGRLALSWDAVADTSGYRVYRRVSGSSDFKFVADTTETAYIDAPAQTGQSYDYQVTALGAHGESAGTVFLSAAAKTESTPLSPPEVTSVTPLDSGTAVIFFSDENTDCEYEIQRKTKSNNWVTLGKTTKHIYYDTAVPDSGTPSYKVVAIGTNGETAESAVAEKGTNPKTVFGVPVLMYHEFVTQEDLDSGIAFDEYAIYAHEFEHDLQWLQKHGYTTITARELAQHLNGQGEMPNKPVILSIDDGKYGVYKNALPLLEKYDMKAVLAAIGTEIDAATEAPGLRGENPAPYCTWQELAEMSASGHIEIASHSYGLHVYRHGDRTGANCSEGDTILEFKADAYADFYEQRVRFAQYNIPAPTTFAYPYSVRSSTADEAWRMCGYEILLGGNMNSVRTSKINYFIPEAGLNDHSALLRRIARMHGTPIEDYIG